MNKMNTYHAPVQVLEMPHRIEAPPLISTASNSIIKPWLLYLIVTGSLVAILLLVWLLYSYYKGSLCRGGEAGVVRRHSIRAEVVEEENKIGSETVRINSFIDIQFFTSFLS